MIRKPRYLAKPSFERQFRQLYVEDGLSLGEVALRLGCKIKTARRVREYLGLPARPHGRPRDDDGDDYVLCCPDPDLPLEPGAFRNFDYGDVALVERLAANAFPALLRRAA